MNGATSTAPAFGKADLSNCEREQIHIPGSIQPHGALLVFSEPDYEVVQASANAAAMLGLARDLIGRSMCDVAPALVAWLRPWLREPLDTAPVALRCRIGQPPRAFAVHAHRPPDGGLIVELEPADAPLDLSQPLEAGLRALVATPSLSRLCDETARRFRDLTGYDRVMVYRFDDEGHGQVIAEQCRADMESFLGNRYPASDIPRIARRLYERTRVRVLADIEYTPVPVLPARVPWTGAPLDMSLCALRSVSPIHVQYMRNMGVRATLVVSLTVGGALWGMIACHHDSPRVVPMELRAVCEVLAEVVATRIAALQCFSEGKAEVSVRRLEQRMIEAISRDGDWRMALFDSTQALLQPLAATGAALLYDGQVMTVGEVPGTAQLREIGQWLDTQPRAPVIVAGSLPVEAPQFAALRSVAAGLVAAPISRAPSEYLLWLRPEQVRTVTWAGNPYMPVVVGDTPADLSPRRSFAKWHEQVEGTCEPWSPADLTAARLIGETVADVVVQFRSVRMLIAQDQLEQIGRQVRLSEQPVVIADSVGRVLLINDAFRRMLPGDWRAPDRIDAMLDEVIGPDDIRRHVWDLLRHRRAWRGEVRMASAGGETRPLLVRADPVFSAPERVLGFVLLFTDLSDRKAADTARRRFQDDIAEGYRASGPRLDPKAGLLLKTLLSTVTENAELAAMEITDSADVARMPDLLDSVRQSLARTTSVLERLIPPSGPPIQPAPRGDG